ncbi:MAG: ATP phosphoribosyltransferase regulatory subunit [Nannocystaceae bacterium]|nr:ATP phosphoribosyltransferase regulatory subunit [Nannocystaceae bacterium]
MSKPSTKPPSGMRDFLPEELGRRHHVIGVIRSVFERYGFLPLETPSIENLAVLTGKYGEDEKLIYRLLHRGLKLGEILADKGVEVSEATLRTRRCVTTLPSRWPASWPSTAISRATSSVIRSSRSGARIVRVRVGTESFTSATSTSRAPRVSSPRLRWRRLRPRCFASLGSLTSPLPSTTASCCVV